MEAQARLVDFTTLSPDQHARLAAASAALRPYVTGIAAEAVAQIERDVPQFVRPHDLRYAEALQVAVETIMGHFVDLMGDQDLPSAELLDLFRKIGAGEAREGRSLDAWQAAVRIGSGVAIGRLTEQAAQLGLGGDVSEIGQIAQAVFAYTDKIADAVAAGHAEAEAQAAGQREGRRQRLIDLLLEPGPTVVGIGELAHKAQWRVPGMVAAVALADGIGRPGLPPEALLGLHRDPPCVIMPDPEGPGRRHQLETGLRDWTAAIGPAVEITGVAGSLRWACQALELARSGIVDPDKLVVATEHMPLIVMRQEHELVELVSAQRLAPLARVREPLRQDLEDTLLTLIEARFNATVVAARLRMHAQTIRYRLRKLEDLFGPDLYEPAHQLELHMVLHHRRRNAAAVSPTDR